MIRCIIWISIKIGPPIPLCAARGLSPREHLMVEPAINEIIKLQHPWWSRITSNDGDKVYIFLFLHRNETITIRSYRIATLQTVNSRSLCTRSINYREHKIQFILAIIAITVRRYSLDTLSTSVYSGLCLVEVVLNSSRHRSLWLNEASVKQTIYIYINKHSDDWPIPWKDIAKTLH